MKILKILKTPAFLVTIIILFIISIVIFFYKKYSFKSISNNGKLSQLQSRNYADALHVAMASMGTDFESIIDVLSKLNEENYKQVYNSFGNRSYFDWFGTGTDLPLATKLNLNQWLNEELSISEKEIIKIQFPFVIN